MLALTKGVESVHNMPLLRRRELARNLVYRVYEQGEIGTRKGQGACVVHLWGEYADMVRGVQSIAEGTQPLASFTSCPAVLTCYRHLIKPPVLQ